MIKAINQYIYMKYVNILFHLEEIRFLNIILLYK